MPTILAVCTSKKKGERKSPMPHVALSIEHGIHGDVHGEDKMRQISLLANESVEKLRTKIPDLKPGDFAENMLTSGIQLNTLPIGTRLKIGHENAVILEVTKIGKECKEGCEIRQLTGDCVMPREGIFAKVIQEGIVKPGDSIEQLPQKNREPYSAAILTISDRSSRGQREDLGGPLILKMLTEAGYFVSQTAVVPDEREQIVSKLIAYADAETALIITTGGTGFSPRDITPEATLEVCERLVPGIPEAMRAEGRKHTERAMLSRQIAGIRGRSLIINLPGSPKAIQEGLAAVLPSLRHGLDILRETASDCAESKGNAE
ncbi:MAG: MOSC domain-containing protein [Clostridiales Family XIII bacterium]|jgi:molybdenum cofactor synthesis domain-containing protein|nr:MOSC domain-containing protein [Clostridiales Family XIII bacterium]